MPIINTFVAGYYMYIETSSPRVDGDNAIIDSHVTLNGNSCLRFYYHMYGSSVKTLNVKVGNKMVFTESGDQGNKWNYAEVRLQENGIQTVSK